MKANKGKTPRKGRKSRVTNSNTLSTHTAYGGVYKAPSTLTKYYDYYKGATSSTATISYQQLTAMAQGAGQSQRVADTIWVHRIEMRLTVTAATTDVTNLVRIGLFAWVPNSASLTPGTTSVLEAPATYGVFSPLNYEGRRDFRLLWDHQFNLTGTSSVPTDNYQMSRVITFNYPKGLRIDYNTGATTGYGQIYFMDLSDSGVAPSPSYIYYFRFWYTDA